MNRYATAQAPAAPRRWGRRLSAAGAVLLALVLAVAAGAWIWAGSESSLATALGWAAGRWPVTARQVTGSLLRGGSATRLEWRDEGLVVEAEQAELRWSPAALWSGTLQLDRVAATRVVVKAAQRTGQAPTTPPASLALPFRLRIAALEIAELRWAGPPALALHDVAARYAYDGAQHRLELTNAGFEGGRYQGAASVGAHAPLAVAAALHGTLDATAPGSDQRLALALQARLTGPLADLRAEADLGPAPGTAQATSGADPKAHVSARLAPWSSQPLPETHARLQAIDLAALWPAAPRTQITGTVDLAPHATISSGWAIKADLQNAQPGPWDQHQLPIQTLQTDVDWQDGAATVRTLQGRAADGAFNAHGDWRSGHAPGQDWRITAQIDGIDPALVHTQLAALPIDGKAAVQGKGQALRFDAALQARPLKAGAAAPGDSLTAELRALRLRSAHARGQWSAGWLTLDELQLQTDDARLAGSARLLLSERARIGGQARLRLDAPGVSAQADGQLLPDRGAGTASLKLADAARALVWARRLPGLADTLASVRASGSAMLQGRWSGGWRSPEVHARLATDRLDIGTAAQAVQARKSTLQVDGTLARWQLEGQGALTQGARDIQWQLAAHGDRAGTADAPIWRATVEHWQASVQDPALGPGRWQLAGRSPLSLSGSTAAGGAWETDGGTLSVAAPVPATQALVTLGPLRWRHGAIASSGRVAGLPLQWLERLGATRLQDAGLTGDVSFNGNWDASVGDELHVKAELALAAGDLTLQASDPETGEPTRIAAGLRTARLALTSDGRALALRLKWDSERAGQAEGELRTELTRTGDDKGHARWSWPATAPLQGRIQARLPQISAWSRLAPPGWRLRGALALDARIAGSRSAPQASGTLSADDLALRSVADGIAFEGGRLRARLAGTRLVIDEFSLRGAGTNEDGGRLLASGEAGWIDGRASARLDAKLERLRASIRADRELTVSGPVHAAFTGRTIAINGQLLIDRARIALPDQSRPALGNDVIVRGAGGRIGAGQNAPGTTALPDARAAASAQPADRPAPLQARIDLQISLGADFRVQGMGIDTRLAGSVRLASDGPLADMPQLTGLVETRGGRFHAYGQNLDITRGRINFTGAADNPQLDIIALRPNFASDQKAGVQVAGSALLPRVRLYSEPQLPDSQALAWLLLGRPAPDTGAEAAMLQSAALALLGGREGRSLASRFGLDELSVASNGAGEVRDASVTLGKRLSNRLYAAYEHSIASASGTLLIFYELSRRWSLRGQASESASAIDLIFRLSFD